MLLGQVSNNKLQAGFLTNSVLFQLEEDTSGDDLIMQLEHERLRADEEVGILKFMKTFLLVQNSTCKLCLSVHTQCD